MTTKTATLIGLKGETVAEVGPYIEWPKTITYERRSYYFGAAKLDGTGHYYRVDPETPRQGPLATLGYAQFGRVS